MTSVHRVVVRGHFHDLDDDTRSRLLADADDHDFLRSAFTADGSFTYDRRLVAFNLRYEVRLREADLVDSDDANQVAIDDGLTRATAWLDGAGLGHQHLRATATDMASLWQS